MTWDAMGRKLTVGIGVLAVALGVSGLAYAAALEVQAEPEDVEIGSRGVNYHVTVTYNGAPVSSGVTFTVKELARPWNQCPSGLSTPTAVLGEGGRYIASAVPALGSGCLSSFMPGRTILRIQATYAGYYRAERLMTIDPVFGLGGYFGQTPSGTSSGSSF